MRIGSNALELELNEAIVELRLTDFLLANFDLQALFVESVGKYYSEDVALWLQDKLTEGKLASFRRMADAVDPIHTLLEMGIASIDKFRLTSTYLSPQGEHTADWELVLGGTYSTGVPIRWRNNRVWKGRDRCSGVYSESTLMAISPEKPDRGIIATEKNKLTFPVLGDFGNELARQFGIVFQIRQQRQEFSKNVFNSDIAPRNAWLNRSFPRCAGSALPPCRPVR